ncbi:MAG: tetratricopeptide repeat protein [Oligoflexia bacterium]|nr:tetratricopeptide repeat protein [Oligoflexia bacterium]
MTSEPTGATVSVRKAGSSEKTNLGVTPLEITTHEILSNAKIDPASPAPFEFLIEKEGFLEQKVLMPVSYFATFRTNISYKMESTAVNRDIASIMVQHLFNSQKFAQKADFDRAHEEIDKALLLDKRFVKAMSMKGTFYYLQSRYRESMKWYEKALEVDPTYEESIKMISTIKTKIEEKKQ